MRPMRRFAVFRATLQKKQFPIVRQPKALYRDIAERSHGSTEPDNKAIISIEII
jgi:hypothetical protein